MLHDLPIPIWAIVILAIVIVIPTYVMIAGRNAEGGLRGRTSHGWSRWRELSQRAADVQARVLLTIFYFTFAAPFGLVLSFFADPLRMKKRPTGSYWIERKPVDETLAAGRRQF
jgi:hypothetical protein